MLHKQIEHVFVKKSELFFFNYFFVKWVLLLPFEEDHKSEVKIDVNYILRVG